MSSGPIETQVHRLRDITAEVLNDIHDDDGISSEPESNVERSPSAQVLTVVTPPPAANISHISSTPLLERHVSNSETPAAQFDAEEQQMTTARNLCFQYLKQSLETMFALKQILTKIKTLRRETLFLSNSTNQLKLQTLETKSEDYQDKLSVEIAILSSNHTQYLDLEEEAYGRRPEVSIWYYDPAKPGELIQYTAEKLILDANTLLDSQTLFYPSIPTYSHL